jgi:hypothetical protein
MCRALPADRRLGFGGERVRDLRLVPPILCNQQRLQAFLEIGEGDALGDPGAGGISDVLEHVEAHRLRHHEMRRHAFAPRIRPGEGRRASPKKG